MGIGASVFMLAIGAIIAFAFNIRVGWLNLDVVGWVLMAAGAFGLIMSLTMLNRRRTITRQTYTGVDPSQVGPSERVVEQRDTYEADRPL
jgi:hypothetical protein